MDPPRNFSSLKDQAAAGQPNDQPPGRSDIDDRMFQTLIEKVNDAIIILQDGKLACQKPAHIRMFSKVPAEKTYDPFRVFYPKTVSAYADTMSGGCGENLRLRFMMSRS